MKVEMKKTAIRMPVTLWDDLNEVAKTIGMTVNGLMVYYIGNAVKQQKMADALLLSPEKLGTVLGHSVDEETQKQLAELAYKMVLQDAQKK